jgi:acetyl-CoA carboxylase carboxyltransferase component
MDWQKELDELRRREELASQLGGPERVKRQHDGGRLTILERVAKLADPGSFHEIGKIAGSARYDAKNDLVAFTPSNFVFGRAEVDGRPVVIGGDDFTVRGGSADATIKGKHLMCERMAQELRLPLIRLVEGSGGGGSVKTIETTGRANVPGVDGWEATKRWARAVSTASEPSRTSVVRRCRRRTTAATAKCLKSSRACMTTR